VVAHWHINEKECPAVYLVVLKWAPLWCDKHLLVESDNMATVATFCKGTSPSPISSWHFSEIFSGCPCHSTSTSLPTGSLVSPTSIKEGSIMTCLMHIWQFHLACRHPNPVLTQASHCQHSCWDPLCAAVPFQRFRSLQSLLAALVCVVQLLQGLEHPLPRSVYFGGSCTWCLLVAHTPVVNKLHCMCIIPLR
jgi:hypothetical protein